MNEWMFFWQIWILFFSKRNLKSLYLPLFDFFFLGLFPLIDWDAVLYFSLSITWKLEFIINLSTFSYELTIVPSQSTRKPTKQLKHNGNFSLFSLSFSFELQSNENRGTSDYKCGKGDLCIFKYSSKYNCKSPFDLMVEILFLHLLPIYINYKECFRIAYISHLIPRNIFAWETLGP